MEKHIRLYDRSRVTCDWVCKRKRYYNYEYNQRGIVPSHTGLELFMGSCLHDALAAIAIQHQAGSVDIDLIASTARKAMFESLSESKGDNEYEVLTFANEQAALVEGLLRGFHKHVWPRLMAQYPTIIAVEKEMTYAHDNLTFMARPDLVVGDAEGNNYYVEYKSTSSKREEWINSWGTAVQLHSTIRAIESTLEISMTGVIIQGLYKGYQSYNKQNSPFCYAYKRNGNPPFTKDEISYEYKAGFKRYPTWELPGGVKAWVDGMSPEVLADQFPQTPPIFLKQDMIDRFFAQRAIRETEIGMAHQMLAACKHDEDKQIILDGSFEQNFEACSPAWGRACQYRQICHGHVVDPLASGFQYRESHHDLEAKQHAEQELSSGS